MLLDPVTQFGQSTSSSQPTYNLVGHSEEDVNETASHSEVIVFKCVPLGLGYDLTASCRPHAHFVAVKLSGEPAAVLVAHLVLLGTYHVVPARVDSINKGISMGRITDALEELDAFLSFQVLQLAVLLDEVLLVNRQLHTLKFVKNAGLSFAVTFS